MHKMQANHLYTTSGGPANAVHHPKVLVPIADGSDPKMSVITANILRRAGADVTVASVGEELTVMGPRGTKLVGDTIIKECRETRFDLIAVPGGLGSANFKTCHLLETIVNNHVAEEGAILSAICIAPLLALAPWGVLKDRKATVYPTFREELSSFCTALEERVVQDGHLITACGPGAELEYVQVLIERLFGKEKSNEMCKELAVRSNPGDEYFFKEINQIEWNQLSKDAKPRILIVVANGVDAIEVATIVDTLRIGKTTVEVASVHGDHHNLEIMAFVKVKMVADVFLDEVDELSYDLILLPGGVESASAFLTSEKLVNMLKNRKETNRGYGAIGTAPALVLEPVGLLKGKKATTCPSLANKLSDNSDCDSRVIIDGNVITSLGAGSALEFSFAILEKFFGRHKIIELSKSMVFTRR